MIFYVLCNFSYCLHHSFLTGLLGLISGCCGLPPSLDKRQFVLDSASDQARGEVRPAHSYPEAKTQFTELGQEIKHHFVMLKK